MDEFFTIFFMSIIYIFMYEYISTTQTSRYRWIKTISITLKDIKTYLNVTYTVS